MAIESILDYTSTVSPKQHPISHMQLEKLPLWVYKEQNKAVKRCVWGASEHKRSVHLLKWELLRKPKELGGMGLKMAKTMNKAMLAKLSWRVLVNKEELWCKLLRAKYGLQKEVDVFREKLRASNIWKNIK